MIPIVRYPDKETNHCPTDLDYELFGFKTEADLIETR